jgi:hypothetical protein
MCSASRFGWFARQVGDSVDIVWKPFDARLLESWLMTAHKPR